MGHPCALAWPYQCKKTHRQPGNPTLELQLGHTALLTPLLLTPSSAGYVQPNFAQDTETTEDHLTAVMELVELEPVWFGYDTNHGHMVEVQVLVAVVVRLLSLRHGE